MARLLSGNHCCINREPGLGTLLRDSPAAFRFDLHGRSRQSRPGFLPWLEITLNPSGRRESARLVTHSLR